MYQMNKRKRTICLRSMKGLLKSVEHALKNENHGTYES